ncbi:MAG: JAB domain-containing protein [SAR324 cluster bacterium]|nr:JAB domain-containing protein [SAR324 cluster bacterium]
MSGNVIDDFKDKLLLYAKSHKKYQYIDNYAKLALASKADFRVTTGSVRQFQWQLFLNILEQHHRNFLVSDRASYHKVKKSFSQLLDFPDQLAYKHFFAQESFSFLSSDEKKQLTNILLKFTNITLTYKAGDLLDHFINHPEKWIVNTIDKLSLGDESFAQARHLYWGLGRTLNQLGYFCIFSRITSQAFFDFSNDVNSKLISDYTTWVAKIWEMPFQERYYLEIAGEALLNNQTFYHDFLIFSGKNNPNYNVFHKVYDNLLYRHERKISNNNLTKFLYQTKLTRGDVDITSENNIFYDIERDFLPMSANRDKKDWIVFWRGVRLFLKRQIKFRRDTLADEIEGVSLDSPVKIVEWINGLNYDLHQESLWVMILNNKNRLRDFYEVSRGTVNQTIAHPREVFAVAIEHRATGIILIHNHPSGDPMPSESDTAITERMRDSGNILGIRMIDHLIVGKDSCYSFNEGYFKLPHH